jgi:predicted glutamine amidotransferase
MNSFFSNGKQLIAVRYCLDEEDYYTLGYTKLRDSDDGYVITTQQYDDKTSWQWLENKTITVFQSDGFQQFNISDH